MKNRLATWLALGALPLAGCAAVPDSPVQAGEPFAEVDLEFES